MMRLTAAYTRFGQDRRGCGDLAVAEAAIAGADPAMLVDLKTLGLEIRTQQAREAAVMHNTAAHGYGADAGCIASGNCYARKSLGNSGVKARGNAGFADSSVHILQ